MPSWRSLETARWTKVASWWSILQWEKVKVSSGGGFEIDVQKFIEERMQEVPLEKGRAKEKESPAHALEVQSTRAAIGALTWAAKEGRPDCAARASLIAGCLNELKVQDILDLNKIINEVKSKAPTSLKIQPVKPDRACFGVITDASYANASGGKSQGAYGVFCYDLELAESGKGKANLLHWRSGKMHRVVNSTLAAEAQSLSKGLQELSWTITVYNELMDPYFDLRSWEAGAKKRHLQAMAKHDMDETLKRGLCLVDATA